MEQNRRDFIRAISLLSISLGLNPINVLSNDINKLGSNKKEFLDEVDKSIEEFNYLTNILNRDTNLLQEDYDKLYKISSVISSDKFKNDSQVKQVQTISRLERKIDRVKVSKSNIKEALIDNSTSDWVGALNAANFGYSLTSTAFSGAACLASLLALPYGAGVPATVVTCPVFLLNAGFTTFAGAQLVGKQSRAVNTLQYSTNNLINVVKNNPSNKFLNSDNYSFKIGDINLSSASGTFQLPVTNNTSTAENDFQEFLKRKLSEGGLLMNEQNLRVFLDEYIEKVGQVQSQLLAEYIERSNQARSQQQNELKQKAAFYKSLGSLTSVLFGAVFPPKEAEILSILTNVGFEYMATGVALGPYGWGAVGIQIATVLLGSKNGSGEFQKYVLKALQHINLQLNTINKKLDDIYYNQIDILVELQEISSKIDSLSFNVLKGLENISEQLNDLSVAIDETERNKYYRQVQASNLKLRDKLIDNASPITNDDVFNEISILRSNFYNHVSDKHFTNYLQGNLDGNMLRKEIFESFNYLTKVSLYDKIGLLAALYEFTPINNVVKANKEVFHPIESYLACQNITSWLTLSDLKKKYSLQLIKDLESKIKKSIVALNKYGDLEVVTSKANDYKELHHFIIARLYTNLNNLENSVFNNPQSNWLKTLKLTPEGYTFAEDPWNRNKIDFNENIADVGYFDVLRDLGMIKRVREISHTPINTSRRSVSENQSLIGLEIGSKVIEIEFSDLIINHKSEKAIIKNLKIQYKKTATCATEHAEARYINLGCTDVFCNEYWAYYSTPKTYSLKTDFLAKWKSMVRNQYNNQSNGEDINNQLKDFDSMDFPDFAKALIKEYINRKKDDFLKNAYANLYKRNAELNGIGTSLMALSLLNKTITTDAIFPFVVDYMDETYVDKDFEQLFGKNYFLEAGNKQISLKEELAQLSKTFKLEIAGEEVALKVENWKDYICLLVKHRIELTASRSLTGCGKLTAKDAEPYLADSMNKLDWFKSKYLKLKD
jgi:hypothetical protein